MKIVNKKAYYNYQILEKLETGIQLTGAEVKSIRSGRVDLGGAFVRIIGSEAYLVNALFPLYEYARPKDYDERRTRKLLLHKSQLIAFKTKVAQGSYALVPVSLYTTKHLIKLEIALARGKKQYEKREAIKRRDLDRDTALQLRGK